MQVCVYVCLRFVCVCVGRIQREREREGERGREGRIGKGCGCSWGEVRGDPRDMLVVDKARQEGVGGEVEKREGARGGQRRKEGEKDGGKWLGAMYNPLVVELHTHDSRHLIPHLLLLFNLPKFPDGNLMETGSGQTLGVPTTARMQTAPKNWIRTAGDLCLRNLKWRGELGGPETMDVRHRGSLDRPGHQAAKIGLLQGGGTGKERAHSSLDGATATPQHAARQQHEVNPPFPAKAPSPAKGSPHLPPMVSSPVMHRAICCTHRLQ